MRSSQPDGRKNPPCVAVKWVELSEQISQCARLLRGEISPHGATTLSDAEFSLLWICAAVSAGGISQKELSTTTGVSPAHISGLVEQLRTKGFLRGRRATADRRRRLWQITPEGRDEIHAVLARLGRWAKRMDEEVGGLPEQLTPLVRRLALSIEHREGSPVCNANEAAASRGRKRGAA